MRISLNSYCLGNGVEQILCYSIRLNCYEADSNFRCFHMKYHETVFSMVSF